MFTVVEVIRYKNHKERLKLLRMNNRKNCKSYEGYITIEKRVGWLYDDRM